MNKKVKFPITFYVCILNLICVYSSSITVPPGIKYQVSSFEKASAGVGVIEQKKGFMHVPKGKKVIIALNDINKQNLKQYTELINRIIHFRPDAYIGLTVPAMKLLTDLGPQCPQIRNLSAMVILDEMRRVNFSAFEKLIRLRVLIVCKIRKRKIIRDGKLLFIKTSKAEQDYINQLVSSAYNHKTI